MRHTSGVQCVPLNAEGVVLRLPLSSKDVVDVVGVQPIRREKVPLSFEVIVGEIRTSLSMRIRDVKI